MSFAPFLKVDTEEADKLCGKYLSRTSNVKQLCRCCECLTFKCDKPRANHQFKTKDRTEPLINSNDDVELKKMSQHNIKNAFHKVRFEAHNEQGMHGACSMKMSHAVSLGVFECVRDCLFEQLRLTSQLSDDFDACALKCGAILKRQSQRDLPKTSFGRGIRKGKLMAKECSEVLLCVAAVSRSTWGRNNLKRKEIFRDANETVIDD